MVLCNHELFVIIIVVIVICDQLNQLIWLNLKTKDILLKTKDGLLKTEDILLKTKDGPSVNWKC